MTIYGWQVQEINDPYDCGISFNSEPIEESYMRDKLQDILKHVGIDLSECFA